MRMRMMVGVLIAAVQVWGSTGAFAGPWEDGMALYNRGDYEPAIRLFRPLAERGNPKAQQQIAVMYSKGEGVSKNPKRAFMWFSFAAARGDAKSKAAMRVMSKDMTPQEMSQLREMAQACEASNYRACEY